MKKTQDTRSGLSMSFLGLIFVVVAASGGAAYAIFKKPEATLKRTASAVKADRRANKANSENTTRASKTDPGSAVQDEAGKTAEAFTQLARVLAERPTNADEGDDDEPDREVWKPAAWRKPAGRQEPLTRDQWTPKSVAALEPEALLESIRDERNSAARRKLVQELLSRGLSSPQMIQTTQSKPNAIVDIISSEPDAVSRAKLADQISAVEMSPEVKEDTAVELLLIPDGSVKVTAMEMLLSEPDNALRRLQDRAEREDDPEKLEVIQGAIQYFQRKERER